MVQKITSSIGVAVALAFATGALSSCGSPKSAAKVERNDYAAIQSQFPSLIQSKSPQEVARLINTQGGFVGAWPVGRTTAAYQVTRADPKTLPPAERHQSCVWADFFPKIPGTTRTTYLFDAVDGTSTPQYPDRSLWCLKKGIYQEVNQP